MSRFVKRIQHELNQIRKCADIRVKTVGDDLQEWLFVFEGPVDTPFQGGEYMGRLKLGIEWPMKPPVISLLTPSGRFIAGNAICIDGISHYHNENYSSTMTIEAIIRSLISFMAETSPEATSYTSGIRNNDKEEYNKNIVALAAKSHEWNQKNDLYKAYFTTSE